MFTARGLRNLRRSLIFFGCVYCTTNVANEFPGTNGAASPELGIELSAAEVAKLPKHVFPDGVGLPAGSGTATNGAPLYREHCAECHGSEGQGGRALELVGDASLLATEYPDKGIAVYWPYAPTLFEYVNRSMPPETPGMFSADELYSLIAFLLEINQLIEPDVVLDQHVLSGLQMPNLDGFNTIAR